MPDGASLCKECKTYQANWRNWIPHVGASIALLTFIIAGISYTAQSISKQVAEWTAEDKIQVAYLNSRGATSYLNVGDNEVIIMQQELSCFGMNLGQGIYKRVAKSDFVTFQNDQGYLLNAETFAKDQPDSSLDLLFFDKDNLELKGKKDMFPNLKTFPAKGSITFFSIHDKKQKKYEFECVCILVKDTN